MGPCEGIHDPIPTAAPGAPDIAGVLRGIVAVERLVDHVDDLGIRIPTAKRVHPLLYVRRLDVAARLL